MRPGSGRLSATSTKPSVEMFGAGSPVRSQPRQLADQALAEFQADLIQREKRSDLVRSPQLASGNLPLPLTGPCI